jgi:hypothetical protein
VIVTLISSRASAFALSLRVMEGDSIALVLSGPCAAEVFLDIDPDGLSLCSFLRNLSEQTQPWSGERIWSALHVDASISATCSSSGIVLLHVEVSRSASALENWSAHATIETELGALSILEHASSSIATRVQG